MAFLALEDNLLLFSSVALGFCFGIYYEVFRFLRLSFPHSVFLVGVEDILFFLPISFVFLLFTYAFSDGLVRWFSLLGTLSGFLLYLSTLGKLLVFFSEKILFAIRRILKFIWRFLLRPVFNVFKNITNYLFTKAKKFAIIHSKKKTVRRLKRQKKAFVKRAGKGF